jgi:hypothetical protein
MSADQAPQVCLTILRATNLPAKDIGGTSDPYCIVRVKGRDDEIFKTTTKQKELNPKWEESTTLTKKIPSPFGCTIVVQVWDYDRLSRDDAMGTATFNLGPPAPAEDIFEFEVPLKCNDTDQAKIFLRLTGARPPVLLLNKKQRTSQALGAVSGSGGIEPDEGDEDTSDQSAGQEEWPAPEDKLMRPDPQSWAVFFLVLSLLIAVFFSGIPLSCVRPPPNRPNVSECAGITDKQGRIDLDMPSFCWTGCMQIDDMAQMVLLALALGAQSFVVIMNADRFMDWLRVSFYVDLWDFSEWTREGALDDVDAGEDPEHPGDEQVKQGLGRFMKFMRRPMENRLKKTLLHKARGMVENSSKSVATRLSSARSVNIFVKLCIFLSWLNVVSEIFFNFSMNTVFFKCQEKDKSLSDSEQHRFGEHLQYNVLFAHIAEAVFLLIAAACVFRARWACHLVVKPVCCHSASPAQRLRAHFKVQGKTFADLPKIVPILEGGFPEDDLLPLSIMEGQHLVGISYDGILYEKADLVWLMGFGDGPERGDELMSLELEDSKEVTLLFKRGGRDLMSYFINFWKMANNPDRGISIALHGMAGVAMVVASLSCWTCVAGINVLKDANLTVSSVDKRLMLLGACGRFGGVGNVTFLAGNGLLVSVAMQLMIMFLYDEKKVDIEEHPNPQLTATLLDVRKNKGLDLERFEEAEAEMAEVELAESGKENKGPDASKRKQDRDCAFAMCYVWVEGKSSKVVNTTVRSFKLDEKALAERARWTRSPKPRKVRLVRKSAARRQQMIKGLPGDYGPPTICIEILDEQGQKRSATAYTLDKIVDSSRQISPGISPTKQKGNSKEGVANLEGGDPDSSEVGYQQIVPATFVAGFCHADVNLGPKYAWETMSQTLALVATILACMDQGFFWLGSQSGSLHSCKDVKNEATCLSMNGDDLDFGNVDFHAFRPRPQEDRPVDFRASVGPWLSIVATVMAAFGLLALRVAAETKRVERPRTVGTTMGQYCQALCNGVKLATGIVTWACGSLKQGFRNTSCWRRRQFSRQFTVSPPGTPLDGYSKLPDQPLSSSQIIP